MAKVKNKRNSGLADKVHGKRKADPVKKKLNPFEVHINKEKLKVLGKKSKHDRGLPGVSRAKAVQKRKETLGTEMKLMHKTNAFIDRRIGEKNAELSAEDRMVARFAAERAQHHSRKSIFNLADDEILTHRGQTLEQIEKFDDPRSSDDEDDDGRKGFGGLDNDFVSEGHFGGGMLAKSEQDGAKSHKDLIEQLIAESKKRKAEKQKEKEQTLDLTEKLDSEWKDLQPVVFKRARMEENDCLIDKLLSEADKGADYDKMMRELRFDRRGTPSDGLKTNEKQAREEREKIEQLEKERQLRMLGDEAATTMQAKPKHRSADDLDDNFELEDEKQFMLAYDDEGKPLVPEHILKDYSVPNAKPKFEDGISDTSSEEDDDEENDEDTINKEDNDSVESKEVSETEEESNKEIAKNKKRKTKNSNETSKRQTSEESDSDENTEVTDKKTSAVKSQVKETYRSKESNEVKAKNKKSKTDKPIELSEESESEQNNETADKKTSRIKSQMESSDESESEEQAEALDKKTILHSQEKPKKEFETKKVGKVIKNKMKMNEESESVKSDEEVKVKKKIKKKVSEKLDKESSNDDDIDNIPKVKEQLKTDKQKEIKQQTAKTQPEIDEKSILFQKGEANDSDGESDDEESSEESTEEEKKDEFKDLRESDEESGSDKEEDSEKIASFFDLKGEGDNLSELLTGKTPSQQSIAIQKLIKKYDPSLAENNKDKLSILYAHMLQYVNDIFADLDNEGEVLKAFLTFDRLAPHFYDLAHTNKVSTKKFIVELLKEKHDRFLKNSKKVPDLDTLIFFKLVSLLYPTSDFRHPVTTPSLIFMTEILALSKYNSAYAISRGFFITALILEYTVLSKRLVPEAVNFLRGILYLCANTSILNPIQVVPPFRIHRDAKILNLETDCSKMEVDNKMAAKDLVLKEIDDDYKIRCLTVCTMMLKEFFDNYNDIEAQECIFEPHLQLYARIDLELYPKKVANLISKTVQYMKGALEMRTYTPLSSEKKKPKALRLYEPDFQEVFTGSKSSKMPREMADRMRLQTKVKKEMKGALREIRRDKAYIASVKIRQKIRCDNVRKEKVKQIFKDASIQQGELNQLKRKK